MEIDRYDECSTGATVHRSGTDYCVFLSNAAPFDGVARRREVTEQGEHLHFQGLPLRERGRCIFSPFLSRHYPTLFSILPSLLLPTPFFCIFHDDASIEILLPLRSSDFKLAVQSSDTSRRRRGRRRRHPLTSLDDSSAEEAATIGPRRIVGFRTSFDGLSRA